MVGIVGRPRGVRRQQRVEFGETELARLDVVNWGCEQHDGVVFAWSAGNDAVENFLDGLRGEFLVLFGWNVRNGGNRKRTSTV